MITYSFYKIFIYNVGILVYKGFWVQGIRKLPQIDIRSFNKANVRPNILVLYIISIFNVKNVVECCFCYISMLAFNKKK